MESVKYYYGVTIICTVRYIFTEFMYTYTNCEAHFMGFRHSYTNYSTYLCLDKL